MLVKVVRGKRKRSPNLDEYFNVTAVVQKVYKRSGIRRFEGSVSFLVCDLPRTILQANGRPRRNTQLLIMGSVKDGYGLVVDDNGYLEVRGGDSKRKGRSCRS